MFVLLGVCCFAAAHSRRIQNSFIRRHIFFVFTKESLLRVSLVYRKKVLAIVSISIRRSMSSSATMGLASSSGASVTTDEGAQDNNNDAVDADVELQEVFSSYHLQVDSSAILIFY